MDNKKKCFYKVFEEYAEKYDLNDPKIYLKYIHTGKVANNSERIAKSLGFSEKDVFLAWKSGMLHDIGRFEQLRRYGTFMDAESIDHAEFGADLLFCEGMIEQFEVDAEEYSLIECAIRNHSCYRLPENLTEREKIFCDLIRDADKVDIFRANYETGMDKIYNVTMEELKTSPITPEVFEAFMEGHSVLRSLKKHCIDHLAGHLALSFELNYEESRKLVKEQGYLKKLADFASENPETQKLLQVMRERLQEVGLYEIQE